MHATVGCLTGAVKSLSARPLDAPRRCPHRRCGRRPLSTTLIKGNVSRGNYPSRMAFQAVQASRRATLDRYYLGKDRRGKHEQSRARVCRHCCWVGARRNELVGDRVNSMARRTCRRGDGRGRSLTTATRPRKMTAPRVRAANVRLIRSGRKTTSTCRSLSHWERLGEGQTNCRSCFSSTP